MSLKFLSVLTPSVIFILLLADSVSCIDEDSAKEQPCFEITKTAGIDPAGGIMSADKTYFPLMSRLNLYRTAQGILNEDWEEINEAEIYYDGCMEFTFDESSSSSVGHGFHGRISKLELRPLSSDWSIVEYGPKGSSQGGTGVCYNTLTDNNTFIFSACCENDNQMLWGVGSTVKTLPKKTVELIQDHALSLGFKKDYFTELRYDSCKSAEVLDKQRCTKHKATENDID